MSLVAAPKKMTDLVRDKVCFLFLVLTRIHVVHLHSPFWYLGELLVDKLIGVQNSVKQEEANPATYDYTFLAPN